MIITQAAPLVTDLTWERISQERHKRLIDESFIHYTSDFSASVSNLSAVSGASPSVSSGRLQLTGSSILKSTTGPVASWYSVEADVYEVAASGKVGAALVKDGSNYIAAVYDSDAEVCQIIVNGSVVLEKDVVFVNSNLKIYLLVAGNALGMWVVQNKTNYYIGTVDAVTDYLVDGALDDYCYGIYTNQSSPQLNQFTSLRGGASGGFGFLNVRAVKEEDGSLFHHNGNPCFTAEWAAVGSLGEYNFTQGNSVMFSVNVETFEVTILGRFYCNRQNDLQTGAFKVVGVTAVKLTWFATENKWLMVYVYSDWEGQYANMNDGFIWLDWDEVFTQTIITQDRLNSYNLSPLLSEKKIYDTSVIKIDGTWYMVASETNEEEGDPLITAGKLVLLYGHGLQNFTHIVRPASPPPNAFYETSEFVRFNEEWVIMYSTYGDTELSIWDFNLNSLGNLDLPYFGNSEIPGYSWYVKQAHGNSYYYLVGFDTRNYSVADVESTTVTPAWSRGRLTIYKANESAEGYEFAKKGSVVNVMAQII